MWDASQTVVTLIEMIGGSMDEDAQRILLSLKRSWTLRPWRDHISHNLELHLIKRREDLFRYPNLDQVITTLNRGAPANVGDLHAIACDYLHQAAEDIKNGPTDSYKMFWNVDQYGRPTEPIPEDVGRDRLLERLRHQLRPLGIDAEREGNYARQKDQTSKFSFPK